MVYQNSAATRKAAPTTAPAPVAIELKPNPTPVATPKPAEVSPKPPAETKAQISAKFYGNEGNAQENAAGVPVQKEPATFLTGLFTASRFDPALALAMFAFTWGLLFAVSRP